MWERFAYYLLAGILLLYLLDGKGMSKSSAADITGTFLALIWLPLFIGGMIADRYLGYIKSIFIGGSLLAAGYLGLILPGDTAMYISLGLIIVGNGFFKPNISTLLGNIYNKEDLKPLKDNAYNIFYMGINIGALICNFAAAYLRNKYGWGYAFGAAGIGMIIGLIVFGSNLKHIKEGDVRKAPQKEDMNLSQILLYVFVPGLIAGDAARIVYLGRRHGQRSGALASIAANRAYGLLGLFWFAASMVYVFNGGGLPASVTRPILWIGALTLAAHLISPWLATLIPMTPRPVRRAIGLIAPYLHHPFKIVAPLALSFSFNAIPVSRRSPCLLWSAPWICQSSCLRTTKSIACRRPWPSCTCSSPPSRCAGRSSWSTMARATRRARWSSTRWRRSRTCASSGRRRTAARARRSASACSRRAARSA